jgi:tetratricopeptide (TPR) repeat protein
MTADASSPANPARMTPEVRRRLQESLEQARQLAARMPCDYGRVHELLAECLQADPGNTIYIDALLENLRRKFGSRRGASWLARLFGNRDFSRAVQAKDVRAILRLGPAQLARDPADVAALRALAEACATLDYPQAELRYLQAAVEAVPQDGEVARHLARSLTRLGRYDAARIAWHRVEAICRGDTEAAATLAALQPNSNDACRQAEISQLELAQRAAPAEVECLLLLADAYIAAGRFDEAEQLLAAALAQAGGELRLRERLEELAIDRSRSQLAIAERQATVSPSAEANNLVRQMRDELNRLELGLWHNRVQRYPQKTELKLSLAVCLKRAGNFSQAAEVLESLREQAAFAVAATIELGECWQHLRQFGKALAFYHRATQLTAGEPESELKLAALYRAGSLAMAMGEATTARDYLNALAEVDPDYKDVRQRLVLCHSLILG